jgi:aminopeptidase N
MHRKLNLRLLTLLLFTSLGSTNLLAQNHHERFDALDVQHYKFDIQLSETTDEIVAKAALRIKFKKELNSFHLDLIKKQADGKGMTVSAVIENNQAVDFKHEGEMLTLTIKPTKLAETRTYTILYKGIPADGLYISENKFGDRTFFADNYPDRGKNWLPLVDHPSDKATVEWLVTAPNFYQTIGNGYLVEQSYFDDDLTMYHWKMDIPISTKVMVFGTARFAVSYSGALKNVPISAWIYPQDKDKGFYDFSKAAAILDYFITHFGPYPFEKLANVQSKTRFGGMENAGNIFYGETKINGTGDIEGTLTHEIAHQWFGNSATEASWHHLWLSESFATYCTDLYWEHQYGRDQFVEKMKSERKTYIDYAASNTVPIINPIEDNYLDLLSPITYEKGAWVLHMLRHKIGDVLFWKGIRAYYDTYKYSNALSADLQAIFEEVADQKLKTFFQQWLYQAGHPQLEVAWNNGAGFMQVEMKQVQKSGLFTFPVAIKMTFEDGSSRVESIDMVESDARAEIEVSQKVVAVEIDPETWLLFEMKSVAQND